MGKSIDISGKKFGRLTAVKSIGKTKSNKVIWLCECDCGKKAEVITSHLISGHTQSCGCYARDKAVEANKTHGLKNTRIYDIWCDMKKRCNNINHWAFHHYGGRGIKVCDEWQNDFQTFYDWAVSNGYEDNLSIDRVNVNGDYSPENCRWATKKEQMNNMRTNHRITIGEKTSTISEWADCLGIPRHRLDDAYRRGKNLVEYIQKVMEESKNTMNRSEV